MFEGAERKIIERLLIGTAVLVTLVVLPGSSYDPINVPKLAILTIGGFTLAGLIGFNFSLILHKQYRLINIIVALFIVNLFLVLIFAGNNFYQSLFGTFGRATGFTAYVSLSFILLSSVYISSASLVKKIGFALVLSGLLSSIYGLLQFLSLDPVEWLNPYSPVVGFLGNPNFQSTFVGFSGVLVFAIIVSKETKNFFKILGCFYLSLSLYVIKQTDSQQGILVLIGGASVILLILILKSGSTALIISSHALFITGTFGVIFGSLNKGPLASVLYKDSVTYRGDYWLAGWRMTLENPLLGVGIDSYGDWYRRERTVEATLRRGPEVVSNSAHNVFLDISSNGGFPLLALYLTMVCLVLVSIVRIIRRSSKFDPAIAGLIAVWFGYQAQSAISLNQLGLAVWGWLISGLIIGYESNTRGLESQSKAIPPRVKSQKSRNPSSQQIAPQRFLRLICGLVVGALVGLPPLVASSSYLSSLRSNNVEKIKQAVYIWPADAFRTGQIATMLQSNKLNKEALEILERAVIQFPDDFSLWRLLAQTPEAADQQIIEAKAQMRRLDPNNPDLK